VDANTLASSSSDNTIRLWDITNQKEIGKLVGHACSVFSLSLVDANTLASGSWDSTIRLWDIKDKKELVSLCSLKNDVMQVCKNSVMILKSKEPFVFGDDERLYQYAYFVDEKLNIVPYYDDGVKELVAFSEYEVILKKPS